MSTINEAIILLVNAGYTVSKNANTKSATPADPAPFGLKLDGTPKKSAAGRPPGSATHNRAAAPAPVVAQPAAPMMVDFLDLDFAPTPAPTPAPKAAPAAPKAAAPAAPKAAPKAAAKPAPAASSAEDAILSDLADLFG